MTKGKSTKNKQQYTKHYTES